MMSLLSFFVVFFSSRTSGGPPLQRHLSDFGPSSSWDSYGGRKGSGSRDYGGRRSEDGYGGMTAEEWNKPLAPNERLERSEVIHIIWGVYDVICMQGAVCQHQYWH